MKVYLNADLVEEPFGGANSFLRTLTHALCKRGMEIVTHRNALFDLALINALTQGITAWDLHEIRAKGVPVIHRKVGYAASGPPWLRASVNGAVSGDRVQLEFEPFIRSSIFQSKYSHRSFAQQGYQGARHAIICNGVDSGVFGLYGPDGRRRSFWNGNEVFRFVISTWSRDWLKGFRYFALLDEILPSSSNISVDLVGRLPDAVRFHNIRVRPPMRRTELASFLRTCHGYLALSEHETCSNSLLEAINTGLQVIYLDSGSNAEFAADHGVRFEGDFTGAVEHLLETYAERLKTLPEHPYDIGPVADQYEKVLTETKG